MSIHDVRPPQYTTYVVLFFQAALLMISIGGFGPFEVVFGEQPGLVDAVLDMGLCDSSLPTSAYCSAAWRGFLILNVVPYFGLQIALILSTLRVLSISRVCDAFHAALLATPEDALAVLHEGSGGMAARA